MNKIKIIGSALFPTPLNIRNNNRISALCTYSTFSRISSYCLVIIVPDKVAIIVIIWDITCRPWKVRQFGCTTREKYRSWWRVEIHMIVTTGIHARCLRLWSTRRECEIPAHSCPLLMRKKEADKRKRRARARFLEELGIMRALDTQVATVYRDIVTAEYLAGSIYRSTFTAASHWNGTTAVGQVQWTATRSTARGVAPRIRRFDVTSRVTADQNAKRDLREQLEEDETGNVTRLSLSTRDNGPDVRRSTSSTWRYCAECYSVALMDVNVAKRMWQPVRVSTLPAGRLRLGICGQNRVGVDFVQATRARRLYTALFLMKYWVEKSWAT